MGFSVIDGWGGGRDLHFLSTSKQCLLVEFRRTVIASGIYFPKLLNQY